MKTILVDAINTLYIKGKGIDQELFNILEKFPDNPKIIATNANSEEIVEFGMDNTPYPLFSMSHQPNKTDPEYFRALLSKYELEPEEVVYIEHNLDAIKSAEAAGIEALIQWQPAKRDVYSLIRELEFVLPIGGSRAI